MQQNGERAEDERKARRLRAEEIVKEKVRPAELLDKLMPFQREGVIEAVARGGRILLGDEMGLGEFYLLLLFYGRYIVQDRSIIRRETEAYILDNHSSKRDYL